MLTSELRQAKIEEADRLRKLAIDIVLGEPFLLDDEHDVHWHLALNDFESWRDRIVKMLYGRLQAIA